MKRDRTGARRPGALLLVLALAWGLAALASPARADECKDAWITAKVKSRLMSDDVVGAFKINVDTDECVVTLNGCVDSPDQIARAANLAKKVKKVRAVRNHLKVCQETSDDPGDD